MNLYDWKNLSITQVILEELRVRQKLLKEELAVSAGVNPLDDRFKCGLITAYNDVLNIELDEETHDD